MARFFCIFYALSLSLIFFRPEVPFKVPFKLKATFQIIFEQNYKNKTAQIARNNDKGGFLV